MINRRSRSGLADAHSSIDLNLPENLTLTSLRTAAVLHRRDAAANL